MTILLKLYAIYFNKLQSIYVSEKNLGSLKKVSRKIKRSLHTDITFGGT